MEAGSALVNGQITERGQVVSTHVTAMRLLNKREWYDSLLQFSSPLPSFLPSSYSFPSVIIGQLMTSINLMNVVAYSMMSLKSEERWRKTL